MNVYRRSPDWAERHAAQGVDIAGRVALYRILVASREYSGGDLRGPSTRLERAVEDARAHAAAPPGTWFVNRLPTKPELIWVLDEAGKDLYMGRPEGFPDAGREPAPPPPVAGNQAAST